jgi:hypothetical protein
VPLVSLQKPILASGVCFAHHNSQELIAGKHIMIIEIFIAKGNSKNSLGYQIQHAMFYEILISVIRKAFGKTAKDIGSLLNLTKKQAATIGCDGATVKICQNFSPSEGLKLVTFFCTLCFHKVTSVVLTNVLESR